MGAPISILHSQKCTHFITFYSPFSESAQHFVFMVAFSKSHSLFSKLTFACVFPFANLKMFCKFCFILLSRSPFSKCCINIVKLHCSILHSQTIQHFLNSILYSQKSSVNIENHFSHSPFSTKQCKSTCA